SQYNDFSFGKFHFIPFWIVPRTGFQPDSSPFRGEPCYLHNLHTSYAHYPVFQLVTPPRQSGWRGSNPHYSCSRNRRLAIKPSARILQIPKSGRQDLNLRTSSSPNLRSSRLSYCPLVREAGVEPARSWLQTRRLTNKP